MGNDVRVVDELAVVGVVNFGASDPCLERPPRDRVRPIFIETGGGAGSVALTGVVGMVPTASGSSCKGDIGVRRLPETGGTGRVWVGGMEADLGVASVRTDRRRRVLFRGGGGSTGWAIVIPSYSSIPIGRSVQYRRNCNRKSRSYLPQRGLATSLSVARKTSLVFSIAESFIHVFRGCHYPFGIFQSP